MKRISDHWLRRLSRQFPPLAQERIIKHSVIDLQIEKADWSAMRNGDWLKGLVAGIIRQHSLVDNGWLARHLHMGARNAVSHNIRLTEQRRKTDRTVPQMAKALEAIVK